MVVWRENIGALSQSFRVVAVDLPGHGDTDKPPTRYSLKLGLEWLMGFLEALGLERATLVGNSIGGLLCMKMALEHPERVSRLVLVSTVGLGRELNFFVRLTSVPLLGELLEQPTSIRRTDVLLTSVFYDRRFAEDGLKRDIFRTRALPGTKSAMLATVRSGVNILGLHQDLVLLRALEKLRVPALILWGANDGIIPVEHAYRGAKAIPKARLHVFDRCGHWPMMEKAEEFNQVVTEFLQDG